jgi:hypothetical protein
MRMITNLRKCTVFGVCGRTVARETCCNVNGTCLHSVAGVCKGPGASERFWPWLLVCVASLLVRGDCFGFRFALGLDIALAHKVYPVWQSSLTVQETLDHCLGSQAIVRERWAVSRFPPTKVLTLTLHCIQVVCQRCVEPRRGECCSPRPHSLGRPLHCPRPAVIMWGAPFALGCVHCTLSSLMLNSSVSYAPLNLMPNATPPM